MNDWEPKADLRGVMPIRSVENEAREGEFVLDPKLLSCNMMDECEYRKLAGC